MNKPTRYSKRLKGEPPEYGIYSIKCSICLENKNIDLFYDNPYCNHYICMTCLYKWCNISLNCPTCKQQLYVQPVYEYLNDDENIIYPPFYPLIFFSIIPPPAWTINIFIFILKLLHYITCSNYENILERLNRLNRALE